MWRTCSGSSRLRGRQTNVVKRWEDAATRSPWCWTGRRERAGEGSRASRRVRACLLALLQDASADTYEPAEIHGFPGIALEVTQSGDIETVWLF